MPAQRGQSQESVGKERPGASGASRPPLAGHRRIPTPSHHLMTKVFLEEEAWLREAQRRIAQTWAKMGKIPAELGDEPLIIKRQSRSTSSTPRDYTPSRPRLGNRGRTPSID